MDLYTIIWQNYWGGHVPPVPPRCYLHALKMTLPLKKVTAPAIISMKGQSLAFRKNWGINIYGIIVMQDTVFRDCWVERGDVTSAPFNTLSFRCMPMPLDLIILLFIFLNISSPYFLGRLGMFLSYWARRDFVIQKNPESSMVKVVWVCMENEKVFLYF